MADAPNASLPPGSTIGILGGGQLGRMLAIAAARLGLKTHIYEPGPAPAGDVSARLTTAAYDDLAALRDFARSVDVVTYEFENVPAEALDAIEGVAAIRPGRLALAVSQDRLEEKRFLSERGIAVADHAVVDSRADLDAAIARIGPGILKTRRLGYDGKGQARVRGPEESGAAFDAMLGAPAIYEAWVPFEREVSVIAARGLDGQVVAYDPGENVHRDGILRTTTVTGEVGRGIRADAALLAGQLLNALDYVGVIGVEMFVAGGRLIVNEFAPRVHNSGHWTIEACLIDQFQQHVRAVAGWPLGDGSRHSDAVMENLIGDEAGRWAELAGQGVGLHLYGKAEARPGRKMGHVTRLSPRT
ncbi:MAG TPA: 5-(carboxyamino)imidazole ribonucleotide synthase [Paracoccaceae bacterium]|nr:5-(carboxyamino)imidazole ribonucleotide synthase [Paracoccaceae bacterium]